MWPTKEGDDTRINRLVIRLDDSQDFIDVYLYTLLDFFANLGGFWRFMIEIGALISGFLVYDLFIVSLMNMLSSVNLI